VFRPSAFGHSSILPDCLDSLERVLLASFPAGPWQTNCYLVAPQPGEECVIIDPGMDAADSVAELIVEHRLKPVAVILTHGHLDHMFSVTPLCRAYASSCWVHPKDRVLLSDPLRAMEAETRLVVERMTAGTAAFVEPDDVRELADGAVVAVAGLTFGVIHAPGHTPGSTMFQTAYQGSATIDSVVFSGDVLFAGSIGRTDLPGGNLADMLESLRTKVLPLPDTVAVLPGHGPQTTMARERAGNPYLQNLAELSKE
jgi:glyoxylase-like metal-dependent hydrolase (beta-lactamase superfamily II)